MPMVQLFQPGKAPAAGRLDAMVFGQPRGQKIVHRRVYVNAAGADILEAAAGEASRIPAAVKARSK